LEFDEFAQIIAAVVAGNGLVFMFGLYCWHVAQAEKKGRDSFDQPFLVNICGLIPPVVMAYGAYLTYP